LFALIALGIVSRLRPSWLAVELKTAAAEHGVRPEQRPGAAALPGHRQLAAVHEDRTARRWIAR